MSPAKIGPAESLYCDCARSLLADSRVCIASALRERQEPAITSQSPRPIAPPEAAIRAYLDLLNQQSKKSELAKAIRYALSNWTALTRYRDDGRLEADNNAAERALRAVALGRKNWLFAGSDDGGERAAAIYTLVGTAKLNELNPEAYLRLVLERIAGHPINRIEELLPWNVVLAVQTAPSLAA